MGPNVLPASTSSMAASVFGIGNVRFCLHFNSFGFAKLGKKQTTGKLFGKKSSGRDAVNMRGRCRVISYVGKLMC